MSASASPPNAEPPLPAAFRPVPRTGVIFVMTQAAARGYRPDDPAWSNLGQGQPETGPLPGAPPRLHAVEPIVTPDLEYAPIPGIPELRAAVAELYNHLYRRGLRSQYTAENVSISPGGRTALTRAAAALGPIHLGHFLPDYTAYEELLSIFRAFTPIPILLDGDRGYDFSVDELKREVLGRGLAAVLLSNPSNPTGKVIGGESFAAWVAAARRLEFTLLLDEFYSHYVWDPDGGLATTAPGAGAPPMVSAARFVEDVDRDPVVIFDGLTKNWRYPGFRVAWTVGPRAVIDAVSSAGSFLDGGGSRPLQRAALDLVRPDVAIAETRAIQAAFRRKRDRTLARVQAMGIHVDRAPEGTFYVWGSVRGLAPAIDTGMKFFRAALERQVIVVPGEFFDVNPGKRRAGYPSRFRHHVRISFGPEEAAVEAGLGRLEAMIREAGGATG